MTPLRPGIVQVRIIRPSEVASELVAGCLTKEERQRAAAFRFPEHAERWSRYRAALRTILAGHLDCQPVDVPIILGEFGKPLLEDGGLHFNLSHEDELALIALSLDGPVGVDLERTTRANDLSECGGTFCHPEEITALPSQPAPRNQELLRIWTAKEAFLKAMGTGFSVPPEKVRMTERMSDADGRKFKLSRLEHPALSNHLAHLCALQEIASVVILDEPVLAGLVAVPEC